MKPNLGPATSKKHVTPAPMASDWKWSEGQAELLKAAQSTKKLVASLRLALASKDSKAEIALVDSLLRGSESLLVSSDRANRALKPAKKKSLQACSLVSDMLEFSQPIPEIVSVRPFLKKSGGFRLVHNHGLMHRTAQDAINRVLGVYFKPRSFQFTRKGTHAAINHARALIEAGYVHVARLDIKNFYSSFSADALMNELPIPADVADHAVVGRHMKVRLDKGSMARGYLNSQYASLAHNLLPLARQGIPTGSSTSSIVSMMTISRLAWLPMGGVAIINFADDFLALAKSEALLAKGYEALIEAVAKLPDGHFILKLKEKGPIAKGIRFLGHRFYTKGGGLRIAPSEASIEKIFYDLDRLEMKLQPLLCKPWTTDHAEAVRLAALYYKRVQGYQAAFSACNDVETRWLVAMHTNLDQALKALGVKKAEAIAAVEPWMAQKLYAYNFKD